MDRRYSPVEHSGLEAVEHGGLEAVEYGGLEAVERNDGLKVVPGSTLPLHQTKQGHENYYLGDGGSDSTRTPETDFGKPAPAYFNATAGEQSHPGQDRWGAERCCGMRKGIFMVVIVIAALVAVIGAVLGGVLGTVLPKRGSKNVAQALSEDGATNHTNIPLETIPGTGLASAIAADGSGRLLTYYQAEDGRVIENSYLDGRWTLDDHAIIDASVVTTDADAASPLAAISYHKDGRTFRQVFFTTAIGAVMTTFSTTTSNNVATSWSTPKSIIDDTAKPGSIALAACTGSGLQGIRVYYPRSDYINEAIYSFSNESWYEGGWLDGSDPDSGVACNTYNASPNYQIVNVYFRNKVTSRLQQRYCDFHSTDYSAGPKASPNQTMAAGSDVAVCSDEFATEYIFYQSQGGALIKTTLPPDQVTYGEFTALSQGIAVGSKLAMSYFNSSASSTGPALTYQGVTSDTGMKLSQWSRSGATLLDTDVT